MWKQSYFWFTQPGSTLNNYDHYFIYFFAALFVLSIVLKIFEKFLFHAVVTKLIGKFSSAFLTLGVSGLIWAGLRYESTPIFANRYWVLVIALILIIWLFFIFKYLFTKFGSEKHEFDRSIINSKYIPTRK